MAEHRLESSDLVYPLFVTELKGRHDVASLPGVARLDVEELLREIEKAAMAGIGAIALFPVIPMERKNATAEEAWRDDNLLHRAIRAVKRRFPEIGIITDVALDPYTDHGHDGLLIGDDIDNDRTLVALARQAVAQAEAGTDIVAPSDMMDGRIRAVRHALDAAHFTQTGILSYAAKYASGFYGPFREAVGSARSIGKASKRTYQMDFRNGTEAIRESLLDIEEGADILLVKPGLPYLDIIYRVKQACHLPIFTYQVSGEYAMLKAAASQQFIEYDACLLESLLAFRRAGADAVFTYAALEAALLLKA